MIRKPYAITREKFNLLGDVLRECTVLSTLHIKTLDLRRCACSVFDFDSRILLLLQQQEPLKDAIQVDLQQLVPVVDGFLELGGDLEGLGQLGDVGVDENRVGITVYNLGEM